MATIPEWRPRSTERTNSTFEELETCPPLTGRLTPVPRSQAGREFSDILATAGVILNGHRPWDIQVHDERLYDRVLTEGTLGAGEAYVDGWWDVDALDDLISRLERADVASRIAGWGVVWLALKARLFNRQSRWRSREVARDHYDLGNDLYEAMLDRRMQYTCGYWKDARTLDQAQENKLDLIARKLQLKAGMRVLELGGGFGGLAQFMASGYGCQVVSYNISVEQVSYARQLCNGLDVRLEQKDYREAIHEPEPFDRVVSIGLCEHIGYKNYRAFLDLASRQLKAGGLFLLHTIGGNRSVTCTDPWIDRYIFPNGMVPSIRQLAEAMEGTWVMEDWHNFGPDYDRTLMSWWSNFASAPGLREKYGERFRRMWRYYLLSSAGAFRSRALQLWQVVLSKGDVPRYEPVR